MNRWKKIVVSLLDSGWTQDALAVECQCAQSTISSIYQGHTKQPGADLAMKLIELQSQGAGVVPKVAGMSTPTD